MHQQMHVLMRASLLESGEPKGQGPAIDEEDFAELEEAQSLFFSSLHGLFRKVMEDSCAQGKTA